MSVSPLDSNLRKISMILLSFSDLLSRSQNSALYVLLREWMNVQHSYLLILSYSGFCCGLLILCPCHKNQSSLGFCPESLFFLFFPSLPVRSQGSILIFIILAKISVEFPTFKTTASQTSSRWPHPGIYTSMLMQALLWKPHLVTAIISRFTLFPAFFNHQQLLNADFSSWPLGLSTAELKHMKRSLGKDGMQALHGRVTWQNYSRQVHFAYSVIILYFH